MAPSGYEGGLFYSEGPAWIRPRSPRTEPYSASTTERTTFHQGAVETLQRRGADLLRVRPVTTALQGEGR
ncbi:hypothetical protein GCM10017562_36750 [Streptomyces roseofulvus]